MNTTINNQPKVIFETGASSHAVNDLILFTDNTRELAEMRDEIYSRYMNSGNNIPIRILFNNLLEKSKIRYYSEFKRSDGCIHIVRMNSAENAEYCNLYVADFKNWKKEHGY